MTSYRLSPLVSLRTLADLAILVDHRRGEILRLNVAAGELVERIDAGAAELAGDDLDFARALAGRGVLIPAGDRPEGSEPETAPPETPAATAAPAAPPGDLLERLNREAARLQVPLHAQVELTYRCPLGCRYCYLGHERTGAEPELSCEELAQLFAELAELGCLFLLLTGGEIFVRPDLERIVAAARRHRLAVSLATSGWQLDHRRMQRLAAGGLDSVQISLHGPDGGTHDRWTGMDGSFDAALDALRSVRDLGVRVQAAVTITRANLTMLAPLTELLERERLRANVSFYVQPRRDGSREPQDLMLDEAGLRRAYAALPPEAPPRMAGLGPGDAPCGAAAHTIAIDPWGAVYPCHGLRLAAGSVRAEPLGRIWQGSPVLHQVRRLRLGDLEDCPACSYRQQCNRCAGFAVGEGRATTAHCDFDCLQARVIASM